MVKTQAARSSAQSSTQSLQAAMHSAMGVGEGRIAISAVDRRERFSRHWRSRRHQNPRLSAKLIRAVPRATQSCARIASWAALSGKGRT
jgi:hypothetical protein